MSEDMSPEQKHTPNSESKETQSQIRDWTTDVKRQIEHGNASVFVHARVDFDIEETGVGQKLVKTRFEGYKNFLLRNTTGEIADEIKGIMDAAVRQGDKEAEDDLVLPREHSRKEDTLYISIVNPLHFLNKTPIARKYAETAMQYAGNKDIVEVRYKQPKADKYDRTSEKIIYMVLPMEESQALQSIIRQGVDANEVRDSLASIFVDEKYRDLFDANLVDVSKGEVVKQAEKPSLNKISLGVSQASGEARFVPGKIEIIDSIPSNKNKSAISDTAGINPDAGQAPGVQAEEINMLLDSIEESANPSDKFSFDPVDGGDGGRGGIAEPPASGGIPFDDDPLPHETTLKDWTVEDLESKSAAELLSGIEKRNKDEQLRITRALLDRLESNRNRLKDDDNTPIYKPLNLAIEQGRLEKAVEKEVGARIRLKETHAIVGMLGANSEFVINNYKSALGEAKALGLLIRPRDWDILYGIDSDVGSGSETMNGIPLRKVDKLMQRYSKDGVPVPDIGVKRLGEKMPSDEREATEQFIIKQIASENNITEFEARKAYKLVHAMADSNFESTIWYRDNVYYSPLSACVHFFDFRNIQDGDRGPAVTQPWIESFGTSFFRQLVVGSGKNKRHFFHEDKWDETYDADDVFDMEQQTLQLTRQLTKQDTERTKKRIALYRGLKVGSGQYAQVMNSRKLEQSTADFMLNIGNERFGSSMDDNALFSYLGSYIPKVLEAQNLLLKSNWTTKDFEPENISKWLAAFGKADPDRRLGLRYHFAGGAIDDMLEFGLLQGVSRTEIEKSVFKALLHPQTYVDEDLDIEKVEPFLTDDEADALRRALKTDRRGIANAILLNLTGYIETTNRR